MGKMKMRLPDSELEIMMIIWEAHGPVSSAYICEKLDGKKEWKVTSVLTFLARLTKKGFVDCKREGKYNSYSALISEEDYMQNQSQSFLEKLYGNSLTTFVSSLYSSKAISDKDLSELREYIDEMTRREQK